jgi:hypothetical protein
MGNDAEFIAPDAETPPSGTVLTTIVLEDDNGITDTMLECYGLSKTVKLLTFIDIFFSMFYLFYNPYFLIPLVFAFIGYAGAKDFDSNKVNCYLLFIALFNFFRILSWGFYIYNNDDYNNIILGSFFVFICFVIELWLVRIVYRFLKCLNKLSNIQLDIIRNVDLDNRDRIYW